MSVANRQSLSFLDGGFGRQIVSGRGSFDEFPEKYRRAGIVFVQRDNLRVSRAVAQLFPLVLKVRRTTFRRTAVLRGESKKTLCSGGAFLADKGLSVSAGGLTAIRFTLEVAHENSCGDHDIRAAIYGHC